MKQNTAKLQAKDLVSIGIFTALYMVICVVFEILGGLGPLIWVFMPTFLALFCGAIYMTLANKVQKFGASLLLGLIPALIFSVRGGHFLSLLPPQFYPVWPVNGFAKSPVTTASGGIC